MDIKTFVKVITKLPPNISVLAKGPTGIGKSHIVHQIAKNLDMPVTDRRLSQMTEGDIIGLPELIDGVTRFAPMDWFMKACTTPTVLFFDELNRATIEVQQCAFQIVLDRELNGHKLHPETRVYAAVNEGSDYQVTDMDPALLRRFYAVELEPTTEDWLNWASSTGNISQVVIDFIKKYPAHLRHSGDMQPGKVYPNPASWQRLDESITYAGIDLETTYNPIIIPMSIGFIGEETTPAFVKFVKDMKRSFSATDVIDLYPENKSKLGKLNSDRKNDILEQIVNYTEKNDLTLTQVENVFLFCEECSEEMSVSFYLSILEIDNIENVKKYSKLFASKVVTVFNKQLEN